MPLFPQFEPQYTQQLMTDTFGGYNHQLKIPDGEWYDTKNLTTDYAPMLANRKPRGMTGRTACGMIEKKALAYVGTDGVLYFNWLPTGLTGLSVGKKQMVSMGAYIVIFPDKVYLNTENLSDYGSLEATYTGNATYQMVRYDGTAANATYVQADAPANPHNAEYWIDTSGEVHILKQWSDTLNDWVSVETVYIKITFSTQAELPFNELDGVTISGSSVADVNGDKAIYATGGGNGEAGWIMVTGLLEQIPADAERITVARTVPDMDYVCEAQNRLWGCYYGMSEDGTAVNEIYGSALGDFKNWRQYQGLSTDSWAGSVGSDGQWTGAVNYLGYPTFFKENRIHRVTISTEGAHRIDETVCRGVQKGSENSLVVVNETLYYKSRTDVCAYQGGFPQGVSTALGTVDYHGAAAGSVNGKYYISMLDVNDRPALFSYDIGKGIWIHEDDLHALGFARVDNELYAYASILNDDAGEIVTLLGSLPTGQARPEGTVSWQAISGVQYYEYPESKRVSRYNIRMKMAAGATAQVYIHYDGDVLDALPGAVGDWLLAGTVTATAPGINHYVLPVRPRRCDHLQIAVTGEGDVRVYSIAKILEVGSDYR